MRQAFAQTNCAARAQIVERLASHYGESRQSIGLGANNQVMEVYASPETGTWTIVVTHPNGLSCLVASGRAYETLTETAGPAGELMYFTRILPGGSHRFDDFPSHLPEIRRWLAAVH